MTSVVGVAFGALLASPLIALCTGSVARADDLVGIGPFAIGGYDDTLTYDSSTLAFDNYTTGTLGSTPFDLDVYQGPTGANSAEYVFTIPLLFQGGIDDVDGTSTPFYSFNAFDFVSPDAGLVTLGGAPSTDGIVTIGPFALDGSTDTLTLDSAGAFDNYLVGSSDSTTFDLDVYSAGPGSGTSEILFTVPSLFQVGLDDVGGVITPIDSFAPVDAFAPDIGLLDLVNSL
ncbi:hypothetical protein [Mycobacterium sp.]|uniref:hypothetical protein n=1 Tax=Mycobacterium sp. TaxID=1785 RepID=UPI003BAF3120